MKTEARMLRLIAPVRRYFKPNVVETKSWLLAGKPVVVFTSLLSSGFLMT